MCSTPAEQIAEIGAAIESLAAEASAAYARTGRRGDDATAERESAAADADQVVIRLARLWAQLAELDPEVAKRLPTYET